MHKNPLLRRRHDCGTKRQDSRFATRSDPKGESQEQRDNPVFKTRYLHKKHQFNNRVID